MRSLLGAECVKSFTHAGACTLALTALASNERSDTLLRHIKIHNARRNNEAISSADLINDLNIIDRESSSFITEHSASREYSNHLPSGSPAGSEHLDGTLRFSPGHGTTATISTLQHETLHGEKAKAPLLSVGTPSRNQDSSDFSDQDVGFTSTVAESIEASWNRSILASENDAGLDESMMDGATFADALVQFDASNWLLDEDFINLSGDDLLFGANRISSDLIYQRPAATNSTKDGNLAPKVLDLRRMWHVQTRSALVDLDYDPDDTGKPPSAARGRDIDELYHNQLTEGLRPPLRNEPLPSIDILVMLSCNIYLATSNEGLESLHAFVFHKIQCCGTPYPRPNIQAQRWQHLTCLDNVFCGRVNDAI